MSGSSKAMGAGSSVLPRKARPGTCHTAVGSTGLTAKGFGLLGVLALFHLPCSHPILCPTLLARGVGRPIPEDRALPATSCWVRSMGNMQGPAEGWGEKREVSMLPLGPPSRLHGAEDTTIFSVTTALSSGTCVLPGKWFLYFCPDLP